MSLLNPILSQSDDDMLGKGIVPGAGGQDTESSILGGIKSPTPSSSLGASLDPGQQIPGSKMHQAGKDAYAQLMPKITADAGTSDYFRQRQEQLEFEKDHPNGAPISKHPGTFGTILHGIAKAGNLAGEILAPGTLENIPGTELHRDRESRELQTSQREAETQENQATQAAATKEKADTEARMADQAKPKEEQYDHFDKYTDLDGTPLLNEKNSGRVVRADNQQAPKGFKPIAPDKPQKDDTPEQQFIDAEGKAGKTVQQAEKEYANLKNEKPPAPEKPQRQMGVTPDGKVIEITPGMTLPEGTQTVGGDIKQNAGKQSAEDALNYAKDYLASNKYTGAGDEALMEKYFELAKPSSGFRMTQPQIEMLTQAQDVVNGGKARLKHLFSPESPYFSDTLRQSIVNTMLQIQSSKGQHSGQGGQPQGSKGAGGGPAVGSIEGGYRFKGGNPADKNSWEKAQ